MDPMTGIYVLPYAGGGASSYRRYGEHFPAVVGTFEMLKLIEAQGLPMPECLVVSGRNAPHHQNRWAQRVSGLDDRAFFSELQAVGGVPAGLNFAMARDFLAIIRADQRMGAGYKPDNGKISLPILVLAGEQDEMTDAAALREWQDYTSGPIEVSWLPGEHYFILDQPDRVAGCIASFRATIRAQPVGAA
jgi:medium-chain acyl-[acyl-carrier-protein] hydrolase